MSNERIHGSTRPHQAEHGNGPRWYFGSSRIGHQRSITSVGDRGVQFPHTVKVFHRQHHFSRTTSSPALKKTGSTSRPHHINGSVSTLGSYFSCGQRQVLPDDKGHGGSVMHRGHACHQPPRLPLRWRLIR